MGSFGATEIIIIIAVLVLFFGAKKIPELARGIGEGMSEFKKATNEELEDDSSEKDSEHREVNEAKK